MSGDVVAVTTCPRCGDLAEVRPAGCLGELVAHCLTRTCQSWFSLPDPDEKEHP